MSKPDPLYEALFWLRESAIECVWVAESTLEALKHEPINDTYMNELHKRRIHQHAESFADAIERCTARAEKWERSPHLDALDHIIECGGKLIEVNGITYASAHEAAAGVCRDIGRLIAGMPVEGDEEWEWCGYIVYKATKFPQINHLEPLIKHEYAATLNQLWPMPETNAVDVPPSRADDFAKKLAVVCAMIDHRDGELGHKPLAIEMGYPHEDYSLFRRDVKPLLESRGYWFEDRQKHRKCWWTRRQY